MILIVSVYNIVFDDDFLLDVTYPLLENGGHRFSWYTPFIKVCSSWLLFPIESLSLHWNWNKYGTVENRNKLTL
jgi:hypothetical protein